MTRKQQQARDRAAGVLLNYFQNVYRHAGKPWHHDYTVEIESIVDDIILAATPPTPGETAHVEQTAELSK